MSEGLIEALRRVQGAVSKNDIVETLTHVIVHDRHAYAHDGRIVLRAPCPDAPRVQAPKPAPKPSPDPKPTPARAGLSRSLLTPDMASVERIERIRAYIAQALPRLRRDGSISHLHLREGQLRHRTHD